MNSAMQIFLWLISSFFLMALLDPWFLEFRKRKVPASVASAVLILTAQILETFSGIFSEISLADAEVLPAQEAAP